MKNRRQIRRWGQLPATLRFVIRPFLRFSPYVLFSKSHDHEYATPDARAFRCHGAITAPHVFRGKDIPSLRCKPTPRPKTVTRQERDRVRSRCNTVASVALEARKWKERGVPVTCRLFNEIATLARLQLLS